MFHFERSGLTVRIVGVCLVLASCAPGPESDGKEALSTTGNSSTAGTEAESTLSTVDSLVPTASSALPKAPESAAAMPLTVDAETESQNPPLQSPLNPFDIAETGSVSNSPSEVSPDAGSNVSESPLVPDTTEEAAVSEGTASLPTHAPDGTPYCD